MKKNIYIKITSLIFATFVLVVFLLPDHRLLAQNYVPLSNLPNMPTINPTDTNSLGVYINFLIPLFIAICAILAVVQIVLGGSQYMTSELVSSRERGKERIRNAIFGLLLALAAWVILNTINPNILKTDLSGITLEKVPAQAPR